MTDKIDLKKADAPLYRAPTDAAVVVDVPEEEFLMVDGHGSPNTGPAFQQAIGAIYATAYTLKFEAKKAGHDFAVMPLEALWWWDEAGPFELAPEKDWKWTLMMRLPDFVKKDDVERAKELARAKGQPGIGKVRFDRYREGRAMQVMHVGPYKDEYPTIQKLHEQIRRAGYTKSGKHHEIYLGDPRRAKPEKLKTILRQPVRWLDEVQA